MELALRPDSTDHDLGSGLSQSTTQLNRFLVAGLAVVGAGLIGANPVAPSPSEIQHKAVQLTSGADDVLADYEDVFSTAGTNLQTLVSGAETAIPELLQQIGTDLSGYGTMISGALTGAETGLENTFYGGWYGNDDGYVFGLFGGSVTDPTNGVTESGSTLQEIVTSFESGDINGAFGYFDTWSLEAFDHTLKSLLDPILSVTSHGVTTLAIPDELLQTFTNVFEEFFTYSFLKNDIFESLLSPEISVAFGFTSILDELGTDLSSGNLDGALTDLLKAPADLLGDLLNGYVYDSATFNPDDLPDTALLNSGSLLDDLLVTWPTMLATALGESTTSGSAEAVTASLPDLLGGLFGF